MFIANGSSTAYIVWLVVVYVVLVPGLIADIPDLSGDAIEVLIGATKSFLGLDTCISALLRSVVFNVVMLPWELFYARMGTGRGLLNSNTGCLTVSCYC